MGGGNSTTNPVIPAALLNLLGGTVNNVLPNQNAAWGGTWQKADGTAATPAEAATLQTAQTKINQMQQALSNSNLPPATRTSIEAQLAAETTKLEGWTTKPSEFMQKQNYEDYFGRPGEGANYTPDTAYAALEQAMGGQGIEGFASPSVYEGIAASSALQNPLAGGPSLQALGERTPDLSTLTNNPMVTNAMKTWSDVQLPTLQNQASLMGLGRSSSLLKGIGASKNAFMLPIMQQAAGYESEAIGRGQQGATTEAANALTAQQNQFGNLFNLSNADTQRKLAASQQLTSMAGTERDWAKERGNFALQDQLRRQALGENLLFQPLGGTASMVGSTTSGGK
jgi:hypothetical protein